MTHPVLLLREGSRLGFACAPRPMKVAHYAPLAQLAEVMRLERIQYGFESHVEYQRMTDKALAHDYLGDEGVRE